jgi:hypothetical protein
MPKLTLVTTTIYVPDVIRDHVRLGAPYAEDGVEIVVAGDLKTPDQTEALCRELDGIGDVKVTYLAPDDQRELLTSYPELDAVLPWNSVQRRDVALLYAYLQGSEVIVTVDDDNLPLDETFFAEHRLVGLDRELPVLGERDAWVNICDLLETDDGVRFYHRGFPLDRRWTDSVATLGAAESRHVVVNAGLWLGDPDVDALTRLYKMVDATALRAGMDSSAVLARGAWTPFDSQNTALAREVLPAYFLSPDVGRYDDIWASYVLVAIINHLGHGIAFGLPLVRQERNPHDYWHDLDLERLGYETTPALVDGLASLRLSGTDYQSCFAEVTTWLTEHATEIAGPKDTHRASLERFAAGLRAWEATFASIN